MEWYDYEIKLSDVSNTGVALLSLTHAYYSHIAIDNALGARRAIFSASSDNLNLTGRIEVTGPALDVIEFYRLGSNQAFTSVQLTHITLSGANALHLATDCLYISGADIVVQNNVAVSSGFSLNVTTPSGKIIIHSNITATGDLHITGAKTEITHDGAIRSTKLRITADVTQHGTTETTSDTSIMGSYHLHNDGKARSFDNFQSSALNFIKKELCQ